MPAVGVGELLGLGEGPGGGEEAVVVGVQGDDPPAGCGRAPGSQDTTRAIGCEAGGPGGDGDGSVGVSALQREYRVADGS